MNEVLGTYPNTNHHHPEYYYYEEDFGRNREIFLAPTLIGFKDTYAFFPNRFWCISNNWYLVWKCHRFRLKFRTLKSSSPKEVLQKTLPGCSDRTCR